MKSVVGTTLATRMSPAAPTNSSSDPGSNNSHKRDNSEGQPEAWGFPAPWKVIRPPAQVTMGRSMSGGRTAAEISLTQSLWMKLVRCRGQRCWNVFKTLFQVLIRFLSPCCFAVIITSKMPVSRLSVLHQSNQHPREVPIVCLSVSCSANSTPPPQDHFFCAESLSLLCPLGKLLFIL